MKNCIYCEGELGDHVKKCKYCGERIIEPSKKASKDSNIEHHNTSIVEQIKENWLFIVIGLGIIRGIINSNGSTIASTRDVTEYSGGLYEVQGQFGSNGFQDGFVRIEAVKDGYQIVDIEKNVILSYTGNEDKVKSDMRSFADKINNGDPIEIGGGDSLSKKELSTVGVLIDNTYAQSYNGIDMSGPDKRISILGNLLLSKISNNSQVKVGFVYSVRLPNDGESVAPESTYIFDIKKNHFPSVLKVVKEGNVGVDYIRTMLRIDEGISLIQTATMTDKSELKNIACEENGSKSHFICYSVHDMIKKISELYELTYKNNNTTHSGNLLLEYLAAKNFYDFKDIYIFTDGQFEIGDKIKMGNLLKGINADYRIGTLAKQYPITVFNAFTYDHYQNNNLFKNYWTSVIQKLSKEYISCNNNNVILIGLLDTSASFKNFAEDFYKNTIFKGCNVSFVSN